MMRRDGVTALIAALVAALPGACGSPAPSAEPVRDEAAAIDIAKRHQCLVPPIAKANWHARLHPDGWYTWYGSDPPHAPALFIFVGQQDGRPGQCYYLLDPAPDSLGITSAPMGPDLPKGR
jgi:hypothetical protein